MVVLHDAYQASFQRLCVFCHVIACAMLVQATAPAEVLTVIAAMRAHSASADIQLRSLGVMANMCYDSSDNSVVFVAAGAAPW